MMTVDEIIRAAGGPKRVVERCRVSPETVRQWRFRGVVPARHAATLVEAADGRLQFNDLLAPAPADANTHAGASTQASATHPADAGQDGVAPGAGETNMVAREAGA
jgi:hypothetical protein